MLVLIIIAIIAFLWAFREDEDLFSLSLICGLVVAGVVGFLGAAFSDAEDPTAEDGGTHELVQISDYKYGKTSGHISGGVFLTTGNIGTNGAAAFSYYQKKDNGYTLETVEAEYAEIRYSDEAPRVERTNWVCQKEIHIEPIFPVFHGLCNERHPTYVFYVPKGSIVEKL